MTLRTQRPTLEEFLHWPEEKPYLEFLHGEARPKAMPDAAHGLVQVRFSAFMGPWADANQGWTLTEQRCILQADGQTDVVLPDVAWWSQAQLPSPPSGPVRVPPTIAIEILSPSDRYGQVQEKVLFYLNAGVPVVWVVDARELNVTVYRRGCPPVLVKFPATLGDELLPGLTIPLSELFARLPGTEPPKVQE